MRSIDSVGMIVADTSRSRAYVQAMLACGLRPACALLLTDEQNTRPGQVQRSEEGKMYEAPWGTFSVQCPLSKSLQDLGAERLSLPKADINDEENVRLIASRPESVFIYSGFGAVILRDPILNCGKNFLHVHGGYLPDFKGSTTNYYSFLEEGTCGASAIFLRRQLDSGPLLTRRKWSVNSIEDMDHGMDAALRAQVLVEALEYFMRNRAWSRDEHYDSNGGHMYYVMHPLLRHIALFSDELTQDAAE